VRVGLFTSDVFKTEKHNTFMCHKLLQNPDDSQIKENQHFDMYLLTRYDHTSGLNHITKL